MKIGFIGFGEAAYNISLGLKGEGVTGIIAYDKMAGDPVMGPMVAGRAAEAEAALLDTAKEVAEQADVIFGAVPSSFALDVCDEIKDVLCEGKIYADVSASTPAVKEKIWEAVRDTGVKFVDAAMLGSLPKDKHQVPITATERNDDALRHEDYNGRGKGRRGLGNQAGEKYLYEGNCLPDDRDAPGGRCL